MRCPHCGTVFHSDNGVCPICEYKLAYHETPEYEEWISSALEDMRRDAEGW
jgi:uncharacterized Zn finger protein (UPF0148 family)